MKTKCMMRAMMLLKKQNCTPRNEGRDDLAGLDGEHEGSCLILVMMPFPLSEL
jgi:hypothetical protein